MVKVKRLSKTKLYVCVKQQAGQIKEFKNPFQLSEYIRKLELRGEITKVNV